MNQELWGKFAEGYKLADKKEPPGDERKRFFKHYNKVDLNPFEAALLGEIAGLRDQRDELLKELGR